MRNTFDKTVREARVIRPKLSGPALALVVGCSLAAVALVLYVAPTFLGSAGKSLPDRTAPRPLLIARAWQFDGKSLRSLAPTVTAQQNDSQQLLRLEPGTIEFQAFREAQVAVRNALGPTAEIREVQGDTFNAVVGWRGSTEAIVFLEPGPVGHPPAERGIVPLHVYAGRDALRLADIVFGPKTEGLGGGGLRGLP